jgi:hypothetical protein
VSWMKFDDRFLDHPKFVRLERKAPSRGLHLWFGLMSYCKQHLTDGRVPRDMVRIVNGPHQRWRMQALDALLEVGLVEAAGEELLIHDYLDWNPSREEITGPQRATRKGESSAPTPLRARPDNGVRAGRQRGESDLITGRQRPDNEVIEGRQHIKNGDSNDLSSPSLVRAHARSESESESESESIQDPPTSPQVLTLVAPSPTGSTSEPPKRRRSKAPRARTLCPIDFKPHEASAAEAWKLGFAEKLLANTVKEFVNHWRSVAELRADWQATFQNRLAVVAERRGLQERKPHDAESLRWQEQRRAAMEAPKQPVQLGADWEKKLGAILA